jgi:hypothetical protein
MKIDRENNFSYFNFLMNFHIFNNFCIIIMREISFKYEKLIKYPLKFKWI